MSNTKTVCVLRSGGDFNVAHVRWLASQVPGLICLSDVSIPGTPTIPLAYQDPGRWAKMELFRPDIDGDILYLDLDTVVLGDLDRYKAHDKSIMLTDFYQRDRAASGMMLLKQSDRGKVWEEWNKNKKSLMANQRGVFFDGPVIAKHLDCDRWDKLFPGEIVSYKKHARNEIGLPGGVNVVCFHGNPRPWDANELWIPEL